MTNSHSHSRGTNDKVMPTAKEPRVVAMLRKLFGVHVEEMTRHDAAASLFEREVVCVWRHTVEFKRADGTIAKADVSDFGR